MITLEARDNRKKKKGQEKKFPSYSAEKPNQSCLTA